eukprot:GHVL01021668.1.p1 GENE.GHVL01021668.1~~GHVL01021668.1.p1  ORF type:complete len:118 (+),score=17.87 GHVL01021668.1:54-407(+)
MNQSISHAGEQPSSWISHGSPTSTTAWVHPAQKIQNNKLADSENQKMILARAVYGIGAPMRMQMERNILARCRRLPGLPSSLLGLEMVLGLSDQIDFEDFMMSESPKDPLSVQLPEL